MARGGGNGAPSGAGRPRVEVSGVGSAHLRELGGRTAASWGSETGTSPSLRGGGDALGAGNVGMPGVRAAQRSLSCRRARGGKEPEWCPRDARSLSAQGGARGIRVLGGMYVRGYRDWSKDANSPGSSVCKAPVCCSAAAGHPIGSNLRCPGEHGSARGVNACVLVGPALLCLEGQGQARLCCSAQYGWFPLAVCCVPTASQV